MKQIFVPPIAVFLLSMLLVYWGYTEKIRAQQSALHEIESNAETLLGAMKGSIQANLRRGRGHKDRIGQILKNLVETTELNHFEIRQDDAVITSAGLKLAPAIITSNGQLLDESNFWLWRTVQLQDHTPNIESAGRGYLRQQSETNIDFSEKQQLIVLGLDAATYHSGIRRSLKHTYVATGIGIVAVLVLATAWIFILRSRELARQLEHESLRADHLSDLQLSGAGLAHETKNPLGLIRGLAQQISCEEEASDRIRGLAASIMEQSDIAAVRLGEFIAFSKKNTPQVEVVKLHEVVTKICDLMQYDAEKSHVNLKSEIGDIHVMADQGMLSQVIVNLLSNALQACSEGDRIDIICGCDKKKTAHLEIKDSGRGIPAHLRPEIFKPYVTGRSNGHGLGLAIVRRIAEDHDWAIEIESVEQKGTSVLISGIQCASEEPLCNN